MINRKALLIFMLILVVSSYAKGPNMLVYTGLNKNSVAEVIKSAERLADRFMVRCTTFGNTSVVVQVEENPFNTDHMGVIRKDVVSGDVVTPMDTPPLFAKARYSYVSPDGDEIKASAIIKACTVRNMFSEQLEGPDAEVLRDFCLLCQEEYDSAPMVSFLLQHDKLRSFAKNMHLHLWDEMKVSVTDVSIIADHTILETYNVYNDCVIKHKDAR